MNNYKGFIVTTLFRDIDVGTKYRDEIIDDFEMELCEFLAAGYSVAGFSMDLNRISALLTKKIDEPGEKGKS